jgi:hypothetical protein
MARAGARILDSGATLPKIEMSTVKHGRIAVPDVFENGWGLFLVYRAHW